MTERSVVYCTNCAGNFVAELDLSLNGNHEITCPLCAHVHYRVVRDGQVTEERWASSSAQPVYVAQTFQITIGNAYINSTNSATSTIVASSWLNTWNLTT